jgi:hypothetical protein
MTRDELKRYILAIEDVIQSYDELVALDNATPRDLDAIMRAHRQTRRLQETAHTAFPAGLSELAAREFGVERKEYGADLIEDATSHTRLSDRNRFDAVKMKIGKLNQLLLLTSAPVEATPAGRPLNQTEKKIVQLCRRKALPGTAIIRKVELSPEHGRRVLAKLVRENHLSNGQDGYRTIRNRAT